MNDPGNISQAWRFVNGFDVPALSAEMREAWGILIDQLSPSQFGAGERGSRTRRSDQLHLRPSIEAFKGYAGFGLGATKLATPANPEDPGSEIHALAKTKHGTFEPRELPAIKAARDALGKAPDAFKARVEEHKAKS